MHYYEVVPAQIFRNDGDYLTYESKEKFNIGQVVLIEVGSKTMPGIIIKKTNRPKYKTKSILLSIEEESLPKQLIDLMVWIAQYYACPMPLVAQTILPSGITKNRRQIDYRQPFVSNRKRTNFVFNKDQLYVFKQLDSFNEGTFLLHGVTGSGKTAIYIETIKKAIVANKSAIVLVPEIALTSQLVSELSNHFQNLIVTHSQMTEGMRFQVWRKILNNNAPQIVLGPRSALFTPLKNIGAIIVDEAHEPSFKQEHAPRYSALRVATMLGRFHKAKVVLGSATPNITDRYLAEKSNKPILHLNELARINVKRPKIELVDMKNRQNFKNHRFLSDKLIAQIEKTLKDGKQVLVFHNRRGSASSTLCEQCGWIAECPRCHLPLVLHTKDYSLKCHVCGLIQKVPTSCPTCKSAQIIHKGIGTQLIEREICKLFPEASVARFDADNKKDESLDKLYDKIYNGKIDIIIGTQIVAKGLDLPHLQTVGVIQADAGLSIPDFNSSERAFQLLSQVIGRVGRNDMQTHVIVQSYQPKHPSIAFGLNQDYEGFYRYEIKQRQATLFPPFVFLLKLTCTYKTEASAAKNTKLLAIKIKQSFGEGVVVFGPAPAFYERLHNTYRWQLIIKSSKRESLINIINLVPKTHWQYELDPYSLI